ncbi:hypothetical protein VIGAN_06062000 [Vigna angularis var. angularis]|uniref:Uncharacterized protein n=1 Tax=Vigna angularis var. angularis TaxID=157739 RepID=A0A0S3S9S2_PHAAN|nr:hypothetical protein VIGAN_06062000 [Vigna angularis var. angularis]
MYYKLKSIPRNTNFSNKSPKQIASIKCLSVPTKNGLQTPIVYNSNLVLWGIQILITVPEINPQQNKKQIIIYSD